MRKSEQDIIDLIVKHGDFFHSEVPPDDFIRGKVGDCYDSSVANLMRYPDKYEYVEGVAFHPKLRKWVFHAWVALKNGKHNICYDPTWMCVKEGVERGVPLPYIGVRMEKKALFRFMADTEYHGVFANYWRNPELAKPLLPFKI